MIDRVLVTGAGGLLGPYLADACAALGTVTTTGRRSGQLPCDLTDPHEVRSLVSAVRPTIVVHAAAMTDVDGCERDPSSADTVNRVCAEHLVHSVDAEARLVMVSTDQVYADGPGPHGEDDVDPVNVYGRTKLAGEDAVLQRPGSLVLRTNFFGPSRSPGRASLSDFVVDRLRAGEPIVLFQDVLFSPLHMATFATVLVGAVAAQLSGIFNAGGRAGASKADFGLAVARRLGLDTGPVTIGSSAELADRAPRPRDLRMDVRRLEAARGCTMPTMAEEVERL